MATASKIPPGTSSLGEAIRSLREQRGLTLRALAERVGLSAPFLSDVEHNRRKTNKLDELANALGVEAHELKDLDGRLPPEFQEWLTANPGLVNLLKDIRKSGQPVPLATLRARVLRLRQR